MSKLEVHHVSEFIFNISQKLSFDFVFNAVTFISNKHQINAHTLINTLYNMITANQFQQAQQSCLCFKNVHIWDGFFIL